MNTHLLLSLTAAGVLFGASIAAADHRPGITITARFGAPLPPPAVVIVREPVRREVMVIERDDRHRHGKAERRRHHRGCEEPGSRRGRAHWDNERRRGRWEGSRAAEIIIVERGWEGRRER